MFPRGSSSNVSVPLPTAILALTHPGISITGNRFEVTGGAVGSTGGGIGRPTVIVGTLIAFTPISGISGMKSERFTAGQLWIERTKQREGPPVVYVCMSGNSAMMFTDPKALLKFVRWPKGTPTGQALREWLDYWDAPQVEPQAETKMVT